MIISPFTSPLLSGLLSDETAAKLFSAEQFAAAMIKCEVALAKASASCGLIPAEDAELIGRAASKLTPDISDWGKTAAANGPPVAAVVRQLRDESGSDWVHYGSTSQDIVDSAFALQLRAFLNHAEKQLIEVGDQLADLAQTHKDTVIAGRTRWQQAAPVTFGFKAANWLEPIMRHRARLAQMRPRVLVAQLGGATGTLASGLSSLPDELPAAYAKQLGLGCASMPWLVQRDSIAELASWLAMVSSSLGKISGDLLLLAQSEIAEARFTGGASTAMPHKNNPVAVEAVASLATHVESLLPSAIASMKHGNERGGVAWQVEWLAIPTMAVATSAALRQSANMLTSLQLDPERMLANIENNLQLCLAPGYAIELSKHLGMPEASKVLAKAAAQAVEQKKVLSDVLASLCDAPIAWDDLKDPAKHIGKSSAFAMQAYKAWKNMQ